MRPIEFGNGFEAIVTQMRSGAEFGDRPEQLCDGNMLPRLCAFAGETACAETCQLKLLAGPREAGKLCAEMNVVKALERLHVNPENFIMVGATADYVGFGDALTELGATEHKDGYSMLPGYNAFFFRPGKDRGGSGSLLTHAAIRMADCGDVVYAFQDSEGADVVGVSHFSRTNMRGPSAYVHELNGWKVSWGELVLGSAVEHYGADPSTVKIWLVAAVERDDFVHHFTDVAKMKSKFPGWDDLGFMHPESDQNKKFRCLIDYREMIVWQLKDSIQDPRLKLRLDQIDASGAINTGDLSAGHASHRAAQEGRVAHGRDMYIVGRAAGA